MSSENLYIALIINKFSISNISSYNDVITLFNETYPMNKLFIEHYVIDGSIIETEKSLDNSRYQVVTKSLSDFTTTANFSWSSVNAVRIYTCIHNDSNVVTGEHFVFYDGLRFENISSNNPLYSLVAAEYIKTLDENPILKRENSTSYVEYRFGIGVS